jgi:hypothetical protein
MSRSDFKGTPHKKPVEGAFKVGDHVIVNRLGSDAGKKLNGLKGVVRVGRNSEGRYGVKVVRVAEVKGIKEENLTKENLTTSRKSILQGVRSFFD